MRLRQLQHADHVRHRAGAGATPSSPPAGRYTFPSAQGPPPPAAAGDRQWQRVCRLVVVLAGRYGFLQLWLWNLDAATGAGTQTALPITIRLRPPDRRRRLGARWPLPAAAGNAARRQRGRSRQVLFVNGGTSVWGVDVNANTVQSYRLPGSAMSTAQDPQRLRFRQRRAVVRRQQRHAVRARRRCSRCPTPRHRSAATSARIATNPVLIHRRARADGGARQRADEPPSRL